MITGYPQSDVDSALWRRRVLAFCTMPEHRRQPVRLGEDECRRDLGGERGDGLPADFAAVTTSRNSLTRSTGLFSPVMSALELRHQAVHFEHGVFDRTDRVVDEPGLCLCLEAFLATSDSCAIRFLRSCITNADSRLKPSNCRASASASAAG